MDWGTGRFKVMSEFKYRYRLRTAWVSWMLWMEILVYSLRISSIHFPMLSYSIADEMLFLSFIVILLILQQVWEMMWCEKPDTSHFVPSCDPLCALMRPILFTFTQTKKVSICRRCTERYVPDAWDTCRRRALWNFVQQNLALNPAGGPESHQAIAGSCRTLPRPKEGVKRCSGADEGVLRESWLDCGSCTQERKSRTNCATHTWEKILAQCPLWCCEHVHMKTWTWIQNTYSFLFQFPLVPITPINIFFILFSNLLMHYPWPNWRRKGSYLLPCPYVQTQVQTDVRVQTHVRIQVPIKAENRIGFKNVMNGNTYLLTLNFFHIKYKLLLILSMIKNSQFRIPNFSWSTMFPAAIPQLSCLLRNRDAVDDIDDVFFHSLPQGNDKPCDLTIQKVRGQRYFLKLIL